jgi:hypothetical protein
LQKQPPFERLTVDGALNFNENVEKEYDSSLGRSPLDLLLSPPDDLDDTETLAGSETDTPSFLSKRTLSSESVPSLESSSVDGSSFSPLSPITPTSRMRRSPPARKLEPISSPPREEVAEHPLATTDIDINDLDFRVFQEGTAAQKTSETPSAAPRRKSAFKSNLTASLRALKSAAKTISDFTAPIITPDDFLTRSIIAIDPRVPYTDERRPPQLQDEPTPALRRYLNPASAAPIGARGLAPISGQTIECTASIQMQTYKVLKLPRADGGRGTGRKLSTPSVEEVYAEVATGPVARQRDMRENSDFIRVAVMEMMMRKNGKLAENVPGRARWALPPRQVTTQVYKIGEGGVPERWIAIAAS